MEANNELVTTVEAEPTVGPITAAVDTALETIAERLATAEARLAATEARLAEVVASASTNAPAAVTNTRKTLPAGTATLLAKQGVALDSIEAGALDAALSSLSIEQRIAVKSQLLRAGLLS